MRLHFFKSLLVIILFIQAIAGVAGQDLLDCTDRPTAYVDIRYDFTSYCLELAVQDPSGGELAFTALAFRDDGALYATRPLAGEVYWIEDTDADGLPDTPRLVAEGLTLPNGLATYKNNLYISGGAHIYRMNTDHEIEVLVNDLPTGEGFWTGDLVIGSDEHIYVTTGAPCDFCTFNDPERGAVLRFDLDGSNRQVIARGLRQPYGLTFHNDVLWVTDVGRNALSRNTNRVGVDSVDWLLNEVDLANNPEDARWLACFLSPHIPEIPTQQLDCGNTIPPRDFPETAIIDQQAHAIWLYCHLDQYLPEITSETYDCDDIPPPIDWLDEINIVQPDAHFGFPYCIGKANTVDLVSESFDCSTATPPAISIATHSTPLGLVGYTDDTFPDLEGVLLVALSGSHNRSDVRGFELVAIHLDEENRPISVQKMTPYDRERDGTLVHSYNPDEGYLNFIVNDFGFTIFPHHLYDVVVNENGWIFFSVGGGQIFALRPR